MALFVLSVIAYLCASISSAVLVCKLANLPDPRLKGSKNPGTTNVLRIGGKWPAASVLFLDAFKGFFAVVVAKMFLSNPMAIGFVALAAIIGHIYPLFFKFQGGKGVATLIGVLFAIYWGVGLVFILIWCGVAKISHYSSLAALVATSIMPFVAWALVSSGYFLSLLLIVLLILYRHRTNIQGLCNGTEAKLGSKP